jgi:hypothetical protein
MRAAPSPSTLDWPSPSSPPILPRDAGHVGAPHRSSEPRHRLGLPPCQASSAVFMPCHHHGEPPAPSHCPLSGLHLVSAHPAHQATPRPTVSRCLPCHCAGHGRGDRAPARPHVRLPGRLGRWPVGCQPGRGHLNRLLAHQSGRLWAVSRPNSRIIFSQYFLNYSISRNGSKL